MDIKNVTMIVRGILEKEPQTRDDDYLLWLRAIEAVAAEKGYKNITRSLSVDGFLSNIKTLPLPKYSTVGRIRRRFQATTPELRGTERTRKARKKKEQEFREFAKIV